MTAFNFLSQFADAVKHGEKRQTIRARGKRRPPRAGEPLQLFTGMRTAYCKKLADVTCMSVDQITISPNSKTVTMPDGRQFWSSLFPDEIEALAKADGFNSAEEFFEFFAKNHGQTFSGYLIKW